MSLTREVAAEAAIAMAEAPEGLSAILRPGCAAAIWSRQPLQSFQTWIDAIEPNHLPEARMILRPEMVTDATSQICEVYGTPDCVERARLIDDVAALADIFAGLMRAPYLLLRFDVVTTNACPKFHIDAVKVRLICTYRGTGTEYGIARDGAEPQRIVTVPTGAPILLRGKLWPESPRSGLLHRSPPIEGTGETRLVLVLDPVVDPEKHSAQQFVH